MKPHDVGILTELRTISTAAMVSTPHLVSKLFRGAINGEHQVARRATLTLPFARAFTHAVITASTGAFAFAVDFTSAAALSHASGLCLGTFFIEGDLLIQSSSVLVHGLWVPPGIHHDL